MSELFKSGEDTMPMDEQGQPIYEDDQTDITETWQVYMERCFVLKLRLMNFKLWL